MEFISTVRGQVVIYQNSVVPLMLIGLKDEQHFPCKRQMVIEQSDVFSCPLIGCDSMLLPGTVLLKTRKPYGT